MIDRHFSCSVFRFDGERFDLSLVYYLLGVDVSYLSSFGCSLGELSSFGVVGGLLFISKF